MIGKRTYLIILISLLLYMKAEAQKNTRQVISVAFYNMENFFDYTDDPSNPGDDEFTPSGAYHYTEGVYKQKLHNLSTVLQQLGTDATPDGAAIIGCAEIENDKVLQDLTAQPEIKDRHYQFVHFESPDERGIDVALIYNPSYFKVLSAKPLHVDLSGTGGKETTRDILYVCGTLDGDTVHVLVNHWPSRRGGESTSESKRVIAANVDKQIIDSLLKKKPAARILLLGDLNDNPTDISLTKILGAKDEKENVKLIELYNPWVKLFTNGVCSNIFNNRRNLFDQIIISGEWLKNTSWHYYKAEIFNRNFLKEKNSDYPHRSFDGNNWINGYSDHFPVLVYLIKEK